MNKLFNKLFPSKEMREYRKMRRRHRKELVKLAKEVRPFDWSWLHDMTLLQIQQMFEYYVDGNNVWQIDESRFEIIGQLKEVLDTQEEIERNYKDDCGLEFVYDEDGEIEKIIQPDDYSERVTSNYDAEIYLYEKFYTLIGKNILGWWD